MYCRAGFESECVAEAVDAASGAGYARAEAGSGLAMLVTESAAEAHRLCAAVPWEQRIFARQWFVATQLLTDLPVGDRATPIAAAIAAIGTPVSALFVETPDSDDTKVLAPLCRALERPISAQLAQRSAWDRAAPWRAHVCFTASSTAWVGVARIDNSAPWPGGVPRLKFPRAAPSRSTLKLEEAFLVFLSAREREAVLRPGLHAVDLGAAPGGWTWQFMRHHIAVTAVDNGAMDASLMETALVKHARVDGFAYRPAKPVDWMVCDMVEQPIRVARLAAQWLAEGWCRRTIFNLKLPMKKRYAEVRRCLDEVAATLGAAGKQARMRCKQLYHDREEVTVYAECRERPHGQTT